MSKYNINNTKLISFVFIFLVFVFLSVQACYLRSVCVFAADPGSGTISERMGGFLEARDAGRPNLRIAGALVAVGLGTIFEGLANFGFHNSHETPLYQDTGWGAKGPHHDFDVQQLVTTQTGIAFAIIVFAPLLVVGLLWFRSTVSRLVFLFVVFGVILGWHPTVISFFFDTMELVSDWPRGYFLFSTGLTPHDMGAVCAVGLMVIYIGRRRKKRWMELVAITGLLQITNEYLGFVFGVGLFVFTYFENANLAIRQRFIASVKPLMIVGATSVLAAGAITYLFFVVRSQGLDEFCTGIDCARYNFASWGHFKFIVANGISLVSPALFFGAVAGLIISVIPGELNELDGIVRDFTVATGLAFALSLVAIIGLWMVPYPSSMARQFMPMALSYSLVALRGAQLLSLSFRARRRHSI